MKNISMLFAWAFCLCSIQSLASTLLSPSDLQFVHYQADGSDQFAVVTWQDIHPGSTVNFTDSGVRADQTFRDTEGKVSWNITHYIEAGTVVSFDLGLSHVSSGTLTVQSRISLSSSGDQLFAFKNDIDSAAIIAGIQMNNQGWDADATSSNTSALPTSLSISQAYTQFNREWDNAIYQGPTSALLLETLKSNISNADFWQSSNTILNAALPQRFDWQPTTIKTSLISLPNSFILSVLGLIIMLFLMYHRGGRCSPLTWTNHSF
ncbi:hypothetical protein [Echinimonas agarilytica]|uniref:Uncharacterized protein n=1 Tax=Echinimonas agarilytica TaxID=1215918 RepID=A0AA41W8M7_9GAMM|nr:hypothetical protein [Echinimonas agarilytica]MCM2681327.1 hypothetical protein [Echinimonas agarilytica]